MATIFIHELKFETIIGVHAWERQIKQALCLDLEFAYDISHAAADDKLEFALDYSTLAARILEYSQKNHFQLIETLAQRLAELLVSEFNLTWLRLKLTKPAALPEAKSVGIILEHGQ